MTWDCENRLRTIQIPGGSVVTNTYGADGLRRKREEGAATVLFMWDGQRLLRESTPPYDVTLGLFTAGLGEYGPMVSHWRGSGGTRLLHPDALGPIWNTTNTVGSVTDSYAFDAFGVQLAVTGSTNNAHRYIGQQGYQTEPSLGLDYVRARWYRPSTGSWLSADPVPSEARYQYVGGRPTVAVDGGGDVSCDNLRALLAGFEVAPNRRERERRLRAFYLGVADYEAERGYIWASRFLRRWLGEDNVGRDGRPRPKGGWTSGQSLAQEEWKKGRPEKAAWRFWRNVQYGAPSEAEWTPRRPMMMPWSAVSADESVDAASWAIWRVLVAGINIGPCHTAGHSEAVKSYTVYPRTTDLLGSLGKFKLAGRIYCQWEGSPRRPARFADCSVRYEGYDLFDWNMDQSTTMLPGCDLKSPIWDNWGIHLQLLSKTDPESGRNLPMEQWRAMYFEVLVGYLGGREDPAARWDFQMRCPHVGVTVPSPPAGAFYDTLWTKMPLDWPGGRFWGALAALPAYLREKRQGPLLKGERSVEGERGSGSWVPEEDIWWIPGGMFAMDKPVREPRPPRSGYRPDIPDSRGRSGYARPMYE